MNLGFLVLFTMMVITPLVPQNSGYFDKTTVIYEIQQVRYVEQKERPEMKAGEASVYITLQQADLDLDQVPDVVLAKAKAAMDKAPNNICLVIDISGSMGYSIGGTGKIRLDLVKEECVTIINEVIKEKDIVSVISFYHKHELVIKHKYIRHASDRKEVIDAIEKLRPIKDGNTFMRQALAAAYTLINEIKDKGQYNNWVVLLTDGEQIENRDPTETKKLVNELVKQHKEEGIGTNVSTVSFFDPNAKAHMEEVAKLGGGTSLFIENEEHLPSQARLASLVIERDQLQKQINTEWKNTEFDVILLCNDGVSLQKADPYNEQEPQIQGNTLIYPHIRLGHIPLGKLISLEVSLSEDAVNQKATILSLSAISRDQSFSLLENYPISFDNPVTADGETGFLTFVIKKDKRGK